MTPLAPVPLAQAPLAPSALAAPILVVGAPRSGTTWLAKIIDSHPDVLYRHEPDEVLPPPVPLTEAAVPPWLLAGPPAALPVASKRPFFPEILATGLGSASSHCPPARWHCRPPAGAVPLPRLVPDLATAPAVGS